MSALFVIDLASYYSTSAMSENDKRALCRRYPEWTKENDDGEVVLKEDYELYNLIIDNDDLEYLNKINCYPLVKRCRFA